MKKIDIALAIINHPLSAYTNADSLLQYTKKELLETLQELLPEEDADL